MLDELYLDHELRLSYLMDCIRRELPPDRAKLGDPVREMQIRWDVLVERRRAGVLPDADPEGSQLPYAELGRTRLDNLRRLLDVVRDERVGGDLVECGTGRGGTGIFMRGYLDANEIENKQVWIADEFRVEQNPADDLDVWSDLNSVRDGFARFGLLDDRVRFLPGSPPEALAESPIKRISLLRIGQCEIVGRRTRPRSDVQPHCDGWRHRRRRRRDAGAQRSDRRDSSRRFGIDETIERTDGSAIWWRKTRAGAASAACEHSTRRKSRAARTAVADANQGPDGRRRLLQHAT